MVSGRLPKNTTFRTGDLLSTLESSLPPSTFTLLRAVAEKASEIAMPLYLVGGSVRDMLLGAPVKDLDMVVEGDAAVLAFEVSKAASGDVLAYSQFGTATVKLEGQRFDLATARQETYRRPGALPTVTPSAIHEDLERRDFSINAMAMALSGPQAGRLLDPHGGKDDLRLGLIRILHAKSFVDDATRILRAVRYEQRLNFRLEEETHRLLLEAVEGGMLDTVSGDRLRRELELMFGEEHPHRPLSRCGELGILRAIHPPLEDGAGARALADHEARNISLAYLAALSYPLTTQEGEAFIHRLHMSSRWAKVVRDTIAVRLKSGGDPLASLRAEALKAEGSGQAPASHPYIGEPDLSPGQLCSFLDQLSPVSVQVSALLSESPRVRNALELYLNHLRYVKPSLNGRDLMALGVAQGPLVGKALQQLKNARIEGRITTREEEIRLVREYVTLRACPEQG